MFWRTVSEYMESAVHHREPLIMWEYGNDATIEKMPAESWAAIVGQLCLDGSWHEFDGEEWRPFMGTLDATVTFRPHDRYDPRPIEFEPHDLDYVLRIGDITIDKLPPIPGDMARDIIERALSEV